MKRLGRFVIRALAVLLVVVAVATAGIYVAAERVLQRRYEVPRAALAVPTDAASIAEGRRLATLYGCFKGCHGRNADGSVMFDDWVVARVVAPDLTAAVRRYSDAELEAIVRHGVRPDGRSVMIMPAQAYQAMTDADLGRIIAFLRSLPPAHGPGPDVSVGPLGRLGLVMGKFRTAAQLRAESASLPAAGRDETARLGRYLAQTICGDCHGMDLRGRSNPDFTSPDLRVVATYPQPAFAALMRTGTALGGRELGLMGRVARSNLSHLTDREIAALYAYLSSLGKRQ